MTSSSKYKSVQSCYKDYFSGGHEESKLDLNNRASRSSSMLQRYQKSPSKNEMESSRSKETDSRPPTSRFSLKKNPYE